MVGIDECLYENTICEGSCTNVLEVMNLPYLVNANKTALVGVRVDVVGECICGARNYTDIDVCSPFHCLNNGRCIENKGSIRCASLFGSILHEARDGIFFHLRKFLAVNVLPVSPVLVVKQPLAVLKEMDGHGCLLYKYAKNRISVSNSPRAKATAYFCIMGLSLHPNPKKLCYLVRKIKISRFSIYLVAIIVF